MDLENALLSRDADPIIIRILQQFVLNLRPNTRNTSADQITSTVAGLLAEYAKPPARSIFWRDDLKTNEDPFDGIQGTIFEQDWDFKLKVLRQLVELQLEHNADIKNTIDLAWGVQHNKHKKKEAQDLPPDPTDPKSKPRLQLVPIGQDMQRKRYWVVDDSPRIYVSTNPWKMAATFESVASTREDYIATIEGIKAAGPSTDGKSSGKHTKVEQNHLALVKALEDRIEAIDHEINRVAKVRRKLEQRALLQAQAEVRTTRTRRQTRKPDYVYNDFANSEDEGEGGDEYAFQEDEDYDEPMEQDEFGQRPGRVAGRRSARNASGRPNEADNWSQWRGERRSSRLGAPPEMQLDEQPPTKRARTEESTASASSDFGQSSGSVRGDSISSTAIKHSAAAIKPGEIPLERVQGKKGSKFWFYAVEPIPGQTGAPAANGASASEANGHSNNGHAANGHVGPPDKDDAEESKTTPDSMTF
ncbi:hypothetical protein HWV62_34811 [Athelia sp. TMB]|nr:hypothetical protein HWV62_34811 [Athelia sp. TMB]